MTTPQPNTTTQSSPKAKLSEPTSPQNSGLGIAAVLLVVFFLLGLLIYRATHLGRTKTITPATIGDAHQRLSQILQDRTDSQSRKWKALRLDAQAYKLFFSEQGGAFTPAEKLPVLNDYIQDLRQIGLTGLALQICHATEQYMIEHRGGKDRSEPELQKQYLKTLVAKAAICDERGIKDEAAATWKTASELAGGLSTNEQQFVEHEKASLSYSVITTSNTTNSAAPGSVTRDVPHLLATNKVEDAKALIEKCANPTDLIQIDQYVRRKGNFICMKACNEQGKKLLTAFKHAQPNDLIFELNVNESLNFFDANQTSKASPNLETQFILEQAKHHLDQSKLDELAFGLLLIGRDEEFRATAASADSSQSNLL